MYLSEDSRVTQMTGGKGVDLSLWSVADPMFLELAGLWWNQLLPRVKPFMYENGGPVAMVQVSALRSDRRADQVIGIIDRRADRIGR